jgi:sialate O-acetylesterase
VLREGGDLIVEFNNGPLVLYDGARPLGFEVCDAERACQYADARVDDAPVRIDARALSNAAFIRFCWADSPVCNVYNETDLPAVPFELAVPAPR